VKNANSVSFGEANTLAQAINSLVLQNETVYKQLHTETQGKLKEMEESIKNMRKEMETIASKKVTRGDPAVLEERAEWVERAFASFADITEQVRNGPAVFRKKRYKRADLLELLADHAEPEVAHYFLNEKKPTKCWYMLKERLAEELGWIAEGTAVNSVMYLPEAEAA
jgi:Ribonuclease G/E